jgi:polysaccharide export outer membrane protein
MVKHAWLGFVFVLLLACMGCSGNRPGPPKNLPAPITKLELGPGDKVEIEVVGEKDLPKDYVVTQDGMLAFPLYIDPVAVQGLDPQSATDKLKKAFVDKNIFKNPQINLRVKEYAGKTVTISGQVAKPSSVPWRANLTIVEALSECGWLTPMGDANHVFLTRQSLGRQVTVIISVEAITEGAQPDIPLQSGDRIKVQASVM